MEINYQQAHLQWNCNGIKSKHEELQILISQLKPKTISLQETKLTTTSYSLNSSYYVYNERNDDRAQQGGVAIIIRKKVNHEKT